MTDKETFIKALQKDEDHTISDFSTTFTSEKIEQVNHPDHYRPGTYEAINVIKEWELNFALGNAVKYICRAGRKNPKTLIQDLEKAVFYLNSEIKDAKNTNTED